jgi:hypothetical protein
MAALLDDKTLSHEKDREPAADAKPHVVIFADRQTLVEETYDVEDVPSYHHGRRTYDAQGKTPFIDMPRVFLVALTLVQVVTVSDPRLVGVAHRGVGQTHGSHLDGKFVLLPEIVDIEEGDVVAPSKGNPTIAGGTHSPVFLPDIANGKVSNHFFRTVRRTVIDHDDLVGPPGLTENGCGRFPQEMAAIVSSNYCGYHFP